MPPRRLNEFVRLERQLGKGGFGTVFLGRATDEGVRICHLEGGKPFAVKRVGRPKTGFAEEIARSLLANSEQRHVQFVQALFSSSSEHVVASIAAFAEPGVAIFTVMELLEGPDLYDFIDGRSVGIPEPDAANLTRQILTAIHYLHRILGALHRDIKPENFGFASPVVPGQPLPTLKLFDLGLAWVLPEPVTDSTAFQLQKVKRAGTGMYMAPESWGGLAGPPSDVFGAGLIAFALLSLQLPFSLLGRKGRDDPARAVRENPLTFSGRAWGSISEAPVRLLEELLNKDPLSRATTTSALANPWVQHGPGCTAEDATKAELATTFADSLEPCKLPARSSVTSESHAVWHSMLFGSERFLSIGPGTAPGHAIQA